MYKAEYSDYTSYNRFENLDGIETKILEHLIYSESKHANNLWKLLKYNTLNALSLDDVTVRERLQLVNNDSGYPVDKRVFLSPFMDDAWEVQCSSVYIFTERIKPIDPMKAVIGITVETVTHSKISVISGDGDPDLNETKVDKNGNITRFGANPNDTDNQGSIVVPVKNRETVLVKSLLAELNGLYLDGIGYLDFAPGEQVPSEVRMPLFNNRSFYGHTIQFRVELSGVSGSGNYGF